MNLLQFKRQKLPKDTLKLFGEAVKVLNHLSGEEYHIVRLMFSQVLALMTAKVTLIAVATANRPSKGSAVAITTDNRFLFPGQREEDFRELCALLDVDLVEEAQRLKELVHPSRFYER